jgi:hypothetical protein
MSGAIGIAVSILVLATIWPLTWMFATEFHNLLAPLVCALVLSVLFLVFFMTAVQAFIRNEVCEARIEQGKLYLSTPDSTHAVEIVSIADFIHGRTKWIASGLSTSKLVLKDGTALDLDDRLIGLRFQRTLKEHNPKIRFITVRSS